MPEYVDPSGDTEQFRAFAHAPEADAPAAASRAPLVAGVVVVVVLLVAVAAWLALS
ncbi:hypothetical protein ABGB16_14885 [Micromonospora sp. B11E3]|uniref:hypothetical protein n=1 Tax=unclassified Micromonospora TaxID=2617518 RepID=UPI00325CD83C